MKFHEWTSQKEMDTDKMPDTDAELIEKMSDAAFLCNKTNIQSLFVAIAPQSNRIVVMVPQVTVKDARPVYYSINQFMMQNNVNAAMCHYVESLDKWVPAHLLAKDEDGEYYVVGE